jgi:precorrin-4 methylase
MKLIIQNNAVAATASDEYVATGTEQDIVSVPDGTDTSNYIYMGKTLAAGQAALLAALEEQRLSVQNRGLLYTFVPAVAAAAAVPAVLGTDGVTVITPAVAAVLAVPAVTGMIQTRDATQYPDLTFISGYTSLAMIAAQQGAVAMPIGFIDAANVSHAMTPAQAMMMGVAVGEFVGSLSQAKQAIRAQINALTETTITTFDITQGWPA